MGLRGGSWGGSGSWRRERAVWRLLDLAKSSRKGFYRPSTPTLAPFYRCGNKGPEEGKDTRSGAQRQKVAGRLGTGTPQPGLPSLHHLNAEGRGSYAGTDDGKLPETSVVGNRG